MHEINWAQLWNTPPSNLCLTSEEVHIWCANLDLSATEIEELIPILSKDEIEKAQKFRFDEHRRRFIAARGRLRQLLATYLELSEQEIKFEYSDRGKPQLITNLNPDNLQFNVSHSHNLALYAFTYQERVGIDLEYLRSLRDAANIARRFFAPKEYELIASLIGDRQQQVFFQTWTIKEAYLKATGEGLSGSIDAVEVSFEGDRAMGLAAIGGNARLAADWLIHSFTPTDNFIATMAVESKSDPTKQKQIKFWAIDN